MAANTNFHSATSTDARILNAFAEIAKELGQRLQDCNVTVNIMNSFASMPPFTLFGLEKQPLALYANEHDGATWQSANVDFTALRLSVDVHREREQGYDIIRFTYRENPDDPVEVGRSLAAVQRQFVPFNRAESMERALGPEMAEFYRLREEGLSRLESLAEKIVKETHEYHMRLDTESDEHKKSLTASFEDKEKAVEEKFQKRTADLEAREKDLDKLRQELDDRSARHARREQSRDLQKKIANRSEKFTLTSDTQRKRWPIHAIFVVLLFAAGGLIARTLFIPTLATDGMASWLEFGRLPLGVLGFALTAIYYIRWNDHWFRQHADQEFRLQQLALDVDRAGYAAEMLLEWQEDKGVEMPAVMVDRLTTGLFTDQTTSGRVQHPSEDAIGVLLKAASNVRLNLPGVGEVTLTGRNINKLDRDLNKKQDE